MKKKDLRSLGNNIPPIVLHFQSAHKRTFNKSIFIAGDKTLERFKRLQIKLQTEDISIIDYADNCMLLAKDWVKQRNVKTVPLNLLTGDWIYNKYKKLKSQVSVKLDAIPDDILYQDEYLVAVEYIRCKLDGHSGIRFMEVVAELDEVLSEEWKSLFMTGRYRDTQLQVLTALEVQYNIQCSSLNDLATKLKENGNY